MISSLLQSGLLEYMFLYSSQVASLMDDIGRRSPVSCCAKEEVDSANESVRDMNFRVMRESPMVPNDEGQRQADGAASRLSAGADR